MAPEVFKTVVRHNQVKDGADEPIPSWSFNSAILHGYCRHRVRQADYPGIIEEEGKSVLGVYADGLTDKNLRSLDFFEGTEYMRIKVQVKLVQQHKDESGQERLVEVEERTANVYVYLRPDNLERVEWDFEHFRKEKMKSWTRADLIFAGELPPSFRCAHRLTSGRL